MNWAQAVKNWGQLGAFGAKSAWGNPLARSAMIGAGIGGAYNYSQNRSVLGGMAMGAGMGAGAYRYGGRMLGSGALRGGWNAMAGALASSNYRGAAGYLGRGIMRGGRDALSLAYSDAQRGIRGAGLLSNRGLNKIRGIF